MHSPDLDQLLTNLLGAHPNIFDLVFVVGRPLQAELDGELREVRGHAAIAKLTPFNTERIALTIIGENQRLLRELLVHGTCDCTFQLANGTRFRVNIFRQRGQYGIVLRRAQSELPTLASQGLGEIFAQTAQLSNGLVIIAGGAGTGKSATLSAIVDEINSTRATHVITLEEPVEFIHPHRKATITQRELGVDFENFADGLRAAMRQAPKVIMLTDVADRATLEQALIAAETGHLVLVAMRAHDVDQAITKMVNLFEPSEHTRTRLRIMETLRLLSTQRLVPRNGGGRVLIQEIIGNNLRVREVIAMGQTEERSFYELMETNNALGWCTFDQSLAKAHLAGSITEETATLYATNRNRLTRYFDEGAKQLGMAAEPTLSLRLDKTVPAPTPPQEAFSMRLGV
ncbi:MAG: type IV pilus twitching motility protein PilT [Chthoniobacteraceae bacterium]